MKNNKGFTLIELIVVMAIIAVCFGIAEASVSTVFSSEAKKCANELNSDISKCRINAMSRSGTVFLKIYRDGGGNVIADYTENGSVVSSDTTGGSRCGVTYTTDAQHSLDPAGAALYLSFDRETGALVTLQLDGGGNLVEAGQQCGSISVSGGQRIFTIQFFPATGAHTLKG